MNVVTSSNHDFAYCLTGLVQSVWRHYGKRPIVYDVGLTDEDRTKLEAEIIPTKVAAGCFDHATYGNSTIIKTTHKPTCIKHYFENFSEEMIFVDADCLFMDRVEETGFDMGVTQRTDKGLDLSDHVNGVLNAGVLFFNTASCQLVDRWARECAKDNASDQKSLTDILSETIDWQHYDHIYDWQGLKIKVFRTGEYNDYHLRSGKILHFKGLRHEKGIYEQLLAASQSGKDIYSLYKKLRHRRKRADSWLGRLLGSDRRP